MSMRGPTLTCLNCDRQLSPQEPLYEINGRGWCERCAAPYRKREGAGIGAMLGASARILVVLVTGAAVWWCGIFLLRVGFVGATLIAGFAAIGAYKLLSVGSGDVDVDARLVPPAERARFFR